jgi:hypothetical protein
MTRRIALIRYAPDYFMPFAQALGAAGFDVYWVHALRSDAAALQRAGVDASHSLDTAGCMDVEPMSLEECRRRLGELERSVQGPRIHDIILMDRHLRRKSTDEAILYLGHVERAVSRFLAGNRIDIVTSGRDTALQMLTMLICRRLGIPWVVPTRARIPQELYGFCQTHDTEQLIQARQVSADDYEWARQCLQQFESKAIKPALKKSARGFMDVVRLLPAHARVFAMEARKSMVDRGFDHARYTLPDLARMYVQRRVNMLGYKLARPCKPLGTTPFALYALHTQPESSIDVIASFHSDQTALVRLIARSLPATHELYVKVHPTDVDGQPMSFYRELASIPGVRLLGHEFDSRRLIQDAAIVFALTGTIAYEAGLLARPVITFARNYFNALPTIRFCETPGHLPELVQQTLGSQAPADAREQIIGFLARLRTCCYGGEVNRTYGTSTEGLRDSDLTTLAQAYTELTTLLTIGTAR